MMFSPSEIVSHVESFIKTAVSDADASVHSALRAFGAFIHGTAAEQDAIALLKSKGYTVEPPPAPPVAA